MLNTHTDIRKPFIIWGLVLAVICICGSMGIEWHGLSSIHFVGYDYAFFYYAFHAVLSHHGNFAHMYNLHLQQVWMVAHHFPSNPFNQYVYPPQFAVIFSAFGLLSFPVSFALWMVMVLILYLLGISCLIKLFWRRIRRIHLIGLLFAATALDPFQIDLAVGNVNSMLFALISISFYFLYRKKRPGWAGAMLGIAVLIKVTPLAILFVFVLRKQWRLCIATGWTIAIGTVLSVLFVGVRPIFEYALHFPSFGHTSMKNGPAPYNQSLVGVLSMFIKHHWLHVPQVVPYVMYVFVSIATLYLIYRLVLRQGLGDWRLDIAFSSLSVIFFSPLVEEPHLVFAIPAMIALTAVSQSASTNSVASLRLGRKLRIITMLSGVTLSLPVAILFNAVVRHDPQLFWIHIQMFVVMTTLSSTTLVLYHVWNKHFANPSIGQAALETPSSRESRPPQMSLSSISTKKTS